MVLRTRRDAAPQQERQTDADTAAPGGGWNHGQSVERSIIIRALHGSITPCCESITARD
jgi:hypothetical protein